MSEEQRRSQFFAVDISTLRVGMLAERTLYLHLKTNGRYVRFVHAFHPLEEHKLEKIKKHGDVFSDTEAVEKAFPLFATTAQRVKTLCEDPNKAPFEKNLQLHQETAWVFHSLFSVEGNANQKQLPLILMNWAFGKPAESTLLSVAEESIEIYERALLHASLSALIAVWLGYSNYNFVSQLLETVFQESIKTGTGYFERNDGDELSQILQFSKEVVKNGFKPLSTMRFFRIARKLLKIFPENMESKEPKEPNQSETDSLEVAA